MIEVIETKYKGYKFRSRTEARWAVFLDWLDIEYEYEYEGFNLGSHGFYLPDFWLPDNRYWLEVKPSRYEINDPLKYVALANYTQSQVIVTGGPPKPPFDAWGNLYWFWPRSNWNDDDYFGGMSWVYVEPIGYRVGSLGLETIADDHRDGVEHRGKMNGFGDQLILAYDKAKSARFEYGKSG